MNKELGIKNIRHNTSFEYVTVIPLPLFIIPNS